LIEPEGTRKKQTNTLPLPTMNTPPSTSPSSMTASTIVLIVLRLFTLQWIMQGIVMILSVTSATVESRDIRILSAAYFPAILLLALCVWLWLSAPWLSKQIVGKQDAVANISGLSLEDIYAFAFLFLGLYFVLTSFAASLNWIYYSLSVGGGTTGNLPPQTKKSFYDLAQHLVTLIAGFTAMLPSRRWAQKLIASQQHDSQK